MKRLLSFISVFTILLTACEGPAGPPGPPGYDGYDGADGGIIVSSAFEIVVDFDSGNNFEFIESYGFEVLPSDVTLVYMLWETVDGQDIWRLMPQTVIFDDGILIYNFDFTQEDVRFFLDGNIDFNTLDDVWTQSQVFRVVVVPADNVDGLDVSDINTVLDFNNIQSLDFR